MLNLRITLDNLLETYHSRVYFEQAPTGKLAPDFPYIVYTFPNSFTLGDQEVFVLDVDVWDNKQDTTELEMLASSIWRALNRYHYIDENIQFSIYHSNRLPLGDDNPSIKRRKLIFELKYYDRGA